MALDPVKMVDKKITNLTFKDLLGFVEADPKLKGIFESSFGFVAVSDTLADAKREMERVAKKMSCNDVFVTQNGKPDEPVLGWITDNTIVENLKSWDSLDIELRKRRA